MYCCTAEAAVVLVGVAVVVVFVVECAPTGARDGLAETDVTSVCV